MKNKIFTTLLCISVVVLTGTAQWSKLKSPETATIIGIHKISGTNIVLAGHANYGILRSTDNGVTWSESNKGTEFRGCSPSRFVQRGNRILAYSQNVTSNIYGTEAYSYYSDDNGVNWEYLYPGVGFGIINDTIYTGDPNSNYLSLSPDNGKTWNTFLTSNLGTLTNKVIYALTCSKENIIVGTALNDGIYFSKDRGATFTKSTDVNGTVRNFYNTETEAYAIMTDGTIYKSSNGGQNWTYGGSIPGTTQYGDCNIVKMGETVFAFNNGGLYKASFSDLNFEQVTTNVNSKNIRSLFVDGDNLFIGSSYGFFKSADSGKTWKKYTSGLSFGDFSSLKQIGNSYYAGTSAGELFTSENAGQSWTLINPASSLLAISDIAVTPGQIHVLAPSLKTSQDSGKTWVDPSTTNLPLIPTLICIESFNDSLFAYYDGGYFGGSGLFVSPNGINFVKSTNNLPGKKIEKLVAFRTSLVAQLQDSGIYRRTGASNMWTKTLSKAKRLMASGNNLFAITSDSLINISTNQGESWSEVSSAPYEYPYYGERVWKAKDSLYALTTNFDLFVSGNNGSTWKNISNELYDIRRSFSDKAFVLGVFNDALFFGVSNNGLFVRGAIPTHVKKDDNIIPNKIYLSQNYPNPFNPSTTINYQIPISGFVSLKVFDVIGREIADLVHQQQAAGNYTVPFNAASLSSGIYFYRLQSGKSVETKKMMLIK